MAQTLYIGNLSYNTTNESLRTFMQDALLRSSQDKSTNNVEENCILDLRIVTNPATQTSKGFGFVDFEDSVDIAKIIKICNGASLDERKIRVSAVQQKPPRDFGTVASKYRQS